MAAAASAVLLLKASSLSQLRRAAADTKLGSRTKLGVY